MNTPKIHVRRPDMGTLCDTLDGRAISAPNQEGWQQHLIDMQKEKLQRTYFACKSMGEVRALHRDGWAEGAARCSELAVTLATVTPTVPTVRRRVRWADTGSELHIDRAMCGDWDIAYRNSHHVAGAPRIVSVVTGFGGKWTLTPEQLFWAGAQLIVVTDALENAGYTVELRGVSASTARPMDHTFASGLVLLDILAKRAGEPLRPDSVAAVFAHAATFRTVGVAEIYGAPWEMESAGFSADVPAALAHAVKHGLCNTADIVIPAAYDMATARANIERALATVATREGV